MLMTVNCSFCPAAFAMMPSEPMWKPADSSSDVALAGSYAVAPGRQTAWLSSELENVGVTMPVWFAGGS